MKIRGFLVSVLLVLLVSFYAHAQNAVVASVGAVSITEAELAREFQKLLPTQGNYHGGISAEKVEEIRQKALDVLIERGYKVQYAIDRGVVLDRLDVANVFMKSEQGYESQEAFYKAIGAEGVDGFRASIERSLLAKEGERLIYENLDVPNEEQVREYYGKHKEVYLQPKQYTASHILVRVDPASNKEQREELKMKAEALSARAKAGENFYNLAYYNSDDRTKYVGGALGTFAKGRTVAEFEIALENMKPGDFVGPIETLYGYHIIYLQDVQEPRQKEFDEVKAELKNAVVEQRRSSIYRKWLEQMKSKYPVQKTDK